MLTFGCVVGVNPAPTVLSRSSLPCIAPWQLYCTSFLGHDALHSGCFPSVFVEESGGPSLLQYFQYSYFRQVQGDDTEVVREFVLLTPCSQSAWTIRCGHSNDTNSKVPFFSWQTAQWYLLHCKRPVTQSLSYILPFPFVPLIEAKLRNPVKPIQKPHS